MAPQMEFSMKIDNHKKLLSFWTNHYQKRQVSGLSRAEYCRANTLKRAQMMYWEKQLESGKSENSSENSVAPRPAFVRAVVSEDLKEKSTGCGGASAQPLRLTLGGESWVEFSPASDVQWIARIIHAMRG